MLCAALPPKRVRNGSGSRFRAASRLRNGFKSQIKAKSDPNRVPLLKPLPSQCRAIALCFQFPRGVPPHPGLHSGRFAGWARIWVGLHPGEKNISHCQVLPLPPPQDQGKLQSSTRLGRVSRSFFLGGSSFGRGAEDCKATQISVGTFGEARSVHGNCSVSPGLVADRFTQKRCPDPTQPMDKT